MVHWPILPESRKKSVCTTVSVCIVLMVVLLVTGCITKPVPDNQSVITSQTTTSPAIPQSTALYKVTIAQPIDSHAEYIKMDSDVYNPGEIIEFSLLTDELVSKPCKGDIFSFRVFFKSTNGSWEELQGPFEAYHPYVAPQPASTAFPGPGPSIPEYRIVTTGWSPAYYRIQSDCLQASHEFLLRNMTFTNPEIRNQS